MAEESRMTFGGFHRKTNKDRKPMKPKPLQQDPDDILAAIEQAKKRAEALQSDLGEATHKIDSMLNETTDTLSVLEEEIDRSYMTFEELIKFNWQDRMIVPEERCIHSAQYRRSREAFLAKWEEERTKSANPCADKDLEAFIDAGIRNISMIFDPSCTSLKDQSSTVCRDLNNVAFAMPGGCHRIFALKFVEAVNELHSRWQDIETIQLENVLKPSQELVDGLETFDKLEEDMEEYTVDPDPNDDSNRSEVTNMRHSFLRNLQKRENKAPKMTDKEVQEQTNRLAQYYQRLSLKVEEDEEKKEEEMKNVLKKRGEMMETMEEEIARLNEYEERDTGEWKVANRKREDEMTTMEQALEELKADMGEVDKERKIDSTSKGSTASGESNEEHTYEPDPLTMDITPVLCAHLRRNTTRPPTRLRMPPSESMGMPISGFMKQPKPKPKGKPEPAKSKEEPPAPPARNMTRKARNIAKKNVEEAVSKGMEELMKGLVQKDEGVERLKLKIEKVKEEMDKRRPRDSLP